MSAEITEERCSSAGDVSAALAAGIRVTCGKKKGVCGNALSALDVATHAFRDHAHRSSTDVLAILQSIPIPFRGILRLTLAGGDVRRLIEMVQFISIEEQRFEWEKKVSMMYPLVISAAASFGIIVLVLNNAPLLVALEPPLEMSKGLSPNTTNPVFDSVLVPSVIAGSILLLAGGFFRLVDLRRTIRRDRDAMFFCRCCAVLDSLDLPDTERVEIWNELVHKGSETCDKPPQPLVQQILRMPQLSRSTCMSYGSGWYRQKFLSGLDRRKKIVPVAGSVVAGVAVLLYGISLIQPLVELFTAIAQLPVVPIWSPDL